MEQKFRLDKTAFKATNAEEADNHVADLQNKIYKERLEAAWALIHQAYGTTAETKLDRTVFSKRKHEK